MTLVSNKIGFVAAPVYGSKDAPVDPKRVLGRFSNINIFAKEGDNEFCPERGFCYRDEKYGVEVNSILTRGKGAHPANIVIERGPHADASIYGSLEFRSFKFYNFRYYTVHLVDYAIRSDRNPDFTQPAKFINP